MAETKRVIYYDQLDNNRPTSGDVIFVDNPTTGTHKMDLKSFVDMINNGFDSSIKSSGVSVSADNYSSIITNVNDQPVNSIYTYGAGLQSHVSNLPSNKAMTIVNLAQKSTGGLGQVMLAVERNGSGDYLYFRTIGGSPAVWSSWVKMANNSDVESVREALDNLDIETDKTLTISGKPADAKAAGDEINDVKADLSDVKSALSYTENLTSNFTTGAYIITNGEVGSTIDVTPVSNAGFVYIIVPCKKSDVFTVTVNGGVSPRAWCLTDTEYKKISAANVITVTDATIKPEQDGYLIVNSTSSFTYSLVHESLHDVGDIVKQVDDALSDLDDSIDELGNQIDELGNQVDSVTLSRINFLAFEQGSLNTGDGTPLENDQIIRSITKISNPMHIDTGSDDYVIATIFIYSASDDSFISYTAISSRSVDLNPSSGTYIRITVRKKVATNIVPSDIQPELFATKMTATAQDTESNTLALTVTENYTDLFVKGAYINNPVSVGQTVSLTPVANASYAYIIIPCRIGDIFTLTGTGGGAQRLYGFITDNYKQAKVAGQNASSNAENFVAPVNGYFVANVQISSTYSLIVTHRGSINDVNDVIHFLGDVTIDYSPLYIKGQTIVDNGAVGDTVTITPTTNAPYGYIVIKCVKGDKFTLTGVGGSTALIWCFTDKSYKILSRATTIDVNNLELIAQQDGYLISNVQHNRTFSLIKTGCNDPSILQNIYNTLLVRFIMPASIYGKSGDSMYAYTPEIFSNWRHLNNYQLTISGLTNAQSIEDSAAPRMILPLATKTMTLKLENYKINEIVNKSISVKTVSTLSTVSCSVLVISDSFVRYKWGDGILKYMSDFAENDGVTLTFIGTRTTGYGYQAEARGGWSALDYLTHYVPEAQRDPDAQDEQKKMPSPFVFSDNDTVEGAYFDFSKYLTDNNLTAPDVIIISLGMNDGNTSANAIDGMITNIHTDYPNIPIIVSMIPTVPRRIDTGDFYTRKTTRENQNLSYLDKFDNRESEKIYISPEHLALDGILGLNGYEQNANPVSLTSGDEVVEFVNNSIHPTAIGAWNIAKWKYETLLYVMQQ